MLTLTTAQNQVLTAEELVTFYLYELEYDPMEEPLRWTNWDVAVTYDGKTYEPQSIKHTEISQSSDGKLNDVTLTIGNLDRQIQYYIEQYNLMGKKVTIRHILADKDASIKGDLRTVFTIKGAKTNRSTAAFTLSVGIDFVKAQVPARRMFARFCSHQFKDENCRYSGTQTTCSKTFSECKRKGNIRNFGGFPAILNERIYF